MEPVGADVYARDCPSRVVLDRIGDRWTALIVGVLDDGPRRFNEIRDAMGITPTVLTETLRALERDGLVVRRAYAEIPPRVEYELTPLGLTLREPLAAIRNWAEAHLNEILAARGEHESTNDSVAGTELHRAKTGDERGTSDGERPRSAVRGGRAFPRSSRPAPKTARDPTSQ